MAAQYPPPPQNPPPPQYQQAPAAPSDAGRVMGIVGIICAFVLPVVGLILGIVSVVQARKGGGSKGLGIAAIIIGAVTTIIATVIVVAAATAIGTITAACAELGPGTHFVNGVTYTCG